MSDLIVGLLANPTYVARIQEKLPPAFQTVEDELKGNPAVGLLREQVIVGMLIAFLGESAIRQAGGGVAADIDCYVGGRPLSIKTVSASGGIRLKWTSNAVKAREFMAAYMPEGDLLVVRIAWGAQGSIRYFPLALQQRTFRRVGTGYLDYRANTNTRGVNLSGEAENLLNRSPESASVPISWERAGVVINPVAKWVEYWRR